MGSSRSGSPPSTKSRASADIGTAPSVTAVPIRIRPPSPVAAGMLLLLLGVAILLAVRRRRRRAEPAEAESPLPAQLAGAASVDRRRPATSPVPRLTQPALTVADITDAPYHWQQGLVGSQDPLTDLANRSLFETETQFAIDTWGAERLCLMLINLDAFDRITIRLGPDGGDQLLVSIAERLRRAVRPRDLVARLDSDNFAILFEDVDRADVNAITRRIMKTVNEPLSINGHATRIQANFGAAQAEPTDNAVQLMQHAATALGQATTATQSHHRWYAGSIPAAP